MTEPRVNPERRHDALLELADTVLGEHFFDPDNEDAYRGQLGAARSRPGRSATIKEWMWTAHGTEHAIRMEALAAWTRFRVTFRRDALLAVVEGNWSFDGEYLQQAVVCRCPEDAGELRRLIAAARAHLLGTGTDNLA